MKRKLTSLSFVFLLILAQHSIASAQVTASSYSTGGVASARAYGTGNTNINATEAASGGGFAQATMIGNGTRGGYATGNAIAASHGGVAIANGRSDARGWGSVANSNTIAASNYGTAIANGSAVARHNAWANSDSTAVTNGGVAISNSHANARGWLGGRGVAHSTAVSATDYGVGVSDSHAYARGLFGGTAVSRSEAYSTGIGGFRHSSATANSRGLFGGFGNSHAVDIRY